MSFNYMKVLRRGIIRADGVTYTQYHQAYPSVVAAYVQRSNQRIGELEAELHTTFTAKRRAEIRGQIFHLQETIKRFGHVARTIVKPTPLQRHNIKEPSPMPKARVYREYRPSPVVKTRTTSGKFRAYDPVMRLWVEFRSEDQQQRFFERIAAQEIAFMQNTPTLITTKIP